VVIAMEAVIERAVVPVVAKNPPMALRHWFCGCQTDFPNGKRLAYCGQTLGKPIYGPPSSPMDLCVLCQDIAKAGQECPHCGKAMK
jgi:hypothetical protein